MIRSWLRYRLGFTRQFSCKKCGWPLMERPMEDINHPGHWRFYCTGCGDTDFSGSYGPRIMGKKRQRIVGWLRVLWREIKGK